MTDPIDNATTTVIAEITRTDTKATALLSAGGILATALGLITTSNHANVYATVLAAALLATALILAALVIRPRLDGHHQGSYLHWATIDPADVADAIAQDTRAERLVSLSALAARKMRALRHATDATIAAVTAIALAAALTAMR